MQHRLGPSAAAVLVLLGACQQSPTPAGREQPDTSVAPVATTDAALCPHGVPQALCTKCNPSLIPVFRARGDWCEEHGFPESICPSCRGGAETAPTGTGAAAPSGDWCGGHGVPESMCTKCNPELIPRFRAAGDWCEEHGFPESICPICNPGTPPQGVAGDASIERRIVRLRSPGLEDTAGIQTVVARRVTLAASVECTARIDYDSARIADVRSLVPGVVRSLRVELGDRVSRRAPLVDLESMRVGEIQGSLESTMERVRTAQANRDRQLALREGDVSSRRQLELAEQELAEANAELHTASAALRMAGASRSGTSGRYTLSAPIAGVVVRRPAIVGMLATESTSLATVADTSVMWAVCEVSERDAARLVLGQRMRVSVPGIDAALVGDITWIGAEVDPRTRTVSARAALDNADGRLRANQFATAAIETAARQAAVSVPRSAIQRVGERSVVFVRTAKGVFEPRVVRVGEGGEVVQIEGRIRDGDSVVTTGAVLLRTEIMPGSIGAGCCEVEGPGED